MNSVYVCVINCVWYNNSMGYSYHLHPWSSIHVVTIPEYTGLAYSLVWSSFTSVRNATLEAQTREAWSSSFRSLWSFGPCCSMLFLDSTKRTLKLKARLVLHVCNEQLLLYLCMILCVSVIFCHIFAHISIHSTLMPWNIFYARGQAMKDAEDEQREYVDMVEGLRLQLLGSTSMCLFCSILFRPHLFLLFPFILLGLSGTSKDWEGAHELRQTYIVHYSSNFDGSAVLICFVAWAICSDGTKPLQCYVSSSWIAAWSSCHWWTPAFPLLSSNASRLLWQSPWKVGFLEPHTWAFL